MLLKVLEWPSHANSMYFGWFCFFGISKYTYGSWFVVNIRFNCRLEWTERQMQIYKCAHECMSCGDCIPIHQIWMWMWLWNEASSAFVESHWFRYFVSLHFVLFTFFFFCELSICVFMFTMCSHGQNKMRTHSYVYKICIFYGVLVHFVCSKLAFCIYVHCSSCIYYYQCLCIVYVGMCVCVCRDFQQKLRHRKMFSEIKTKKRGFFVCISAALCRRRNCTCMHEQLSMTIKHLANANSILQWKSIIYRFNALCRSRRKNKGQSHE